MDIRKLFFINGVFNALGAVVLVILVNELDKWLGLAHSSDFVWHLLAVCSLSLATLSFYAVGFKEKVSIRAAVNTFLVFNGLAAIVSIWAITDGLKAIVWVNTLVHLLFFVLFLYFGIIKLQKD